MQTFKFFLLKQPKFFKSSFQEEQDSFIQYIDDMIDGEPSSQQQSEWLSRLRLAYESADFLSQLKQEEWVYAENTQSFSVRTRNDVVNVLREDGKQRNVDEVILEYGSRLVRAPIFIRQKSGSLYRISGEVRLMVARYLGVYPKVVIIESF